VNVGDIFILDGQKVLVAGKGELSINYYGCPDSRLRVIFNSGTESDLLVRSLQRALNKDKASCGVTEPDMGPLFSDEEEEGAKGAKAKRNLHPRQAGHDRTVHAGFLWEAVGRLAEFPTLRDVYCRLAVKDFPVSPYPPPIELPQRLQKFVKFSKENGQIVDALEILLVHWKQDIEDLPSNVKGAWKACYLDLWYEIGSLGSVPSTPAELPGDSDTGQFTWQGRTTFVSATEQKWN
jgi:hypothetical protein